MALFKCKMCGGDLEVVEGVAVAECEYCGTQQTLPKTTDENTQSLFNKANLLRQENEFDKAEAIYEKIIEADETEAEAYWGVILCKFGIEYVEDPETKTRIPTCHRASYESIVADAYYKKAMEYADITQRTVYEAQAKAIDGIQKEILALAQNQEAYDVFICYKESDENKRRTQDSVIANDIYYQLKNEGYKVFYAAITLEGKLGSAYEPIIFAALNSAKVMLALGTKPEYFNAVWVKNEWSRFLKIIKKDRSKLLIPCYRDMDAYELPPEFAHLQAQDMSKIGFINDIVRGIKKVIKKEEPKPAATVSNGNNSAATPLVKRAFMFLEDGEFERADEFCEKALNLDPENAMAYVGKLMAEFEIQRQDDLGKKLLAIEDSSNYHKAYRFADAELKATLAGYVKSIDNIQNELYYITAKSAMDMLMEDDTADADDWQEVYDDIIQVGRYKDAEQLAEYCLKKIDEIRDQEKAIKNDAILLDARKKIATRDLALMKQAASSLVDISGYKDADELLAQCQQYMEEDKRHAEIQHMAQETARKDNILAEAIAKRRNNDAKSLEMAIDMLCGISGHKNADELLNECKSQLEDVRKAEKLDALKKERVAKKNKLAANKATIEKEEKKIASYNEDKIKKKAKIGAILAMVFSIVRSLFWITDFVLLFISVRNAPTNADGTTSVDNFWSVLMIICVLSLVSVIPITNAILAAIPYFFMNDKAKGIDFLAVISGILAVVIGIDVFAVIRAIIIFTTYKKGTFIRKKKAHYMRVKMVEQLNSDNGELAERIDEIESKIQLAEIS